MEDALQREVSAGCSSGGAWARERSSLHPIPISFSNEAMRNDRRPALLNLLAGPNGRLLF